MVVVPAPGDAVVAGPTPPSRVERRFEHEGRLWTARGAGGGAAGTGALGLAHVDAVHFVRDGESQPAFEALTAHGRLEHLHDDELIALLRGATPIVAGG
ncbi:MAG TPA: hypothetical protein VK939_13010 [Longimicrobiales bacterium]|nr:hypothetical protein [Longimicrobiales bacterium]